MDLAALIANSNGYLAAVGSKAIVGKNHEFDDFPSVTVYANDEAVPVGWYGRVGYEPATKEFHAEQDTATDVETDTFATLAEALDFVRGLVLVHEERDTTPKPLTEEQQDQALAIVAEWLGGVMVLGGPAPTGEQAFRTAQGPMLVRDWEPWSGGPRPTVLLEGGPEDWAVHAQGHQTIVTSLFRLGMRAEAQSPYALCLYPA